MSESPQAGPGAELKTAREGMDVSTREVADALNLPVHVIEALEADDYERLPPTVFTRGYLRSYARLLELSPESLLARYPEVTEEIDAITGEMPAVDAPAAAPTRSLGIAAVVGVILIAMLVWLLGDDEAAVPTDEPAITDTGAVTRSEAESEPEAEPEPGDRSAGTTVESASAGQAEETLPQRSVEQTVQAPLPAPETSAPAPVTSGSAPEALTEEPVTGPETDVAQSTSITDDAIGESEATGEDQPAAISPSRLERRITEFGDDEITFLFSEDCWVEVKSLDGENLYSDLNRTGRTLVLTGRAPFRILLGYAPGVSLSFNGEPVNLERYSRNNVANLVLGE